MAGAALGAQGFASNDNGVRGRETLSSRKVDAWLDRSAGRSHVSTSALSAAGPTPPSRRPTLLNDKLPALGGDGAVGARVAFPAQTALRGELYKGDGVAERAESAGKPLEGLVQDTPIREFTVALVWLPAACDPDIADSLNNADATG